MSRWKAAGIHLSISVLIGLAVLALLFWVWYPAPYFQASGGQKLALTLVCVDLMIGPLLTLIVFKAGKKGLAFDLGTIAILQLGALLFGLSVITQARPVYLVGAVDRFTVVAANEIDPADLAKGTKPEFSTLSWSGPRLVAARLPTDITLRNQLAFAAAGGGPDIDRQPAYYVGYADEAAHLLTRAKPLADLRSKGAAASTALDDWLRNHPRIETDVAWLPMKARDVGLTMLVDAKTGAVLAALPIDPW